MSLDFFYLKHLIQKVALSDSFSRDQISFKEKFRITESIDMVRACQEILDFFITRNGEDPKDYKVEITTTEPLLFADDYDWHEAIANGALHGPEEDLPFIINLTEGEVWTVTLEDALPKKAFAAPSPSYIQSPVREIVERYRKKKYLEDKPAKPFRKKPTLQIEELIGFPIFEERRK